MGVWDLSDLHLKPMAVNMDYKSPVSPADLTLSDT